MTWDIYFYWTLLIFHHTNSTMEACILMPMEMSIILLPHPDPRKIFEMGVTLWANNTIRPGTIFKPDEGVMRLDKLEVYDTLPLRDIRYKFGCTDTIMHIDNREVRHCNWVRFLCAAQNPDDVNIIASRIQGQYLYQVIKTIHPNTELRAYFDLGPRINKESEILEEMSMRIHEKENLLLSPSSGSTSTHSTSGSPQSDYDEDRNTTISSDDSPLSLTIKDKVSESNSDFLSTPSGKSTKSTTDDMSSPFTSPLEGKRYSPGCILGSPQDIMSPPDLTSPPGYRMALLGHMPKDYSDGTPTLPIRRKEKTWLPCDVCGKKFDRPSLLKRHMRTHTGEKPHACDVCGKAFSTSSSLNTHRRIHSGEKPHQCQVCGKCFTASSNLYYHRMTHKKEKPHKCSMCAKSFPTPGDLKSHMYVHNGSWPFKCEVCNRGFSKQTNLKNHQLLHTGDKPHECHLCGKKFALQCNLKTHAKTHEDEPQDECVRCQQKYLLHRRQVINGVCIECSSPSSRDRSLTTRPPINPFSIEALVSPPGNKIRQMSHAQTTPININKAPFYAGAMMTSSNMIPFHSYGHDLRAMTARWPPHPPISQRFGM